MTEISVGNKIIGSNHRPFIIAEMSGNHNQSLERALAIVDAAAEAGADAIKLQTYTANTMTMPGIHKISDEDSPWKGKELYDLYKQAYTPWEWHKEIFDRAASLGLVAFSSPFDETAVDFLEELGVPLYKIASFENTDHLLLKKVGKTGKPVIISTGVATIADLQESLEVIRSAGCTQFVLLKCTSTYPASPEQTNILTIPHMRMLFDCMVGLSDHTMGIGTAISSIALGSVAIEKHFTLNRADGGVDSTFSLEPKELKSLVVESERAWLSLGKVTYTLSQKEQKSMVFKRSLFASSDIKKGEPFTVHNIRSLRPASGLHTRYYDSILGKKAMSDIPAGTPIQWEHVEIVSE